MHRSSTYDGIAWCPHVLLGLNWLGKHLVGLGFFVWAHLYYKVNKTYEEQRGGPTNAHVFLIRLLFPAIVHCLSLTNTL